MLIKAGLQSCSFADDFVVRPAETLQILAKSGYKYIESADNMFDERLTTPLSEIRKMMDDAGIVHYAKHHCPLNLDTLDEQIKLMHAVGGQYLALATGFYPDMDTLKYNCDCYNEAGRRLKAEGLTYTIHNHCHELQHFGDKTVLELIVENTDPELVQIEVDIMWVRRGGMEPWELFPKIGDRVRLLHIGDFCKEHGSFWDEVPEDSVVDGKLFGEKNINTGTDIGEGKLDIQRSIDSACQHTKVEVGFIELSSVNTKCKDLYEAAIYGINNLKKYRGIICE